MSLTADKKRERDLNCVKLQQRAALVCTSLYNSRNKRCVLFLLKFKGINHIVHLCHQLILLKVNCSGAQAF